MSVAVLATVAALGGGEMPLTVMPRRGPVSTVFELGSTAACGDEDVIGDGCRLVIDGPRGTACQRASAPVGFGTASGRIRFGPRLDDAEGNGRRPARRRVVFDGSARRTWCPGRYVVTLADPRGVLRPAVFCVSGASCRAPRPCRVSGGRVELRRGDVSLVSTPLTPAGLFGCRATARPVRLAGGGAQAQDIAGDWVAWSSSFSFGGATSSTVAARDLRTGRRLSVTFASGSVTKVVVSAGGDLVYSVAGRIVLLTAAGERPLAAGPGVDETSLARSGRTFFWLQDGRPQSFTAG